MTPAPLIVAAAMAAVHFFAGRLRFLDGIPRSRWLSIAGGISVAYVVVHLLPEFAEYQEGIEDATGELLLVVERHVYVLVLMGLITFYAVERSARKARHEGSATRRATTFSFAMYGIYNSVIGYLLVGRGDGLLFFAIAMGLHFVVNDHGLREHHSDAYHRYGRWLLAALVILGAVVGYVVEVHEPVIGVLVAFIGGGTILNVLKEELPQERESRFWAFLAGAAIYTLLLVLQ